MPDQWHLSPIRCQVKEGCGHRGGYLNPSRLELVHDKQHVGYPSHLGACGVTRVATDQHYLLRTNVRVNRQYQRT